MPKKETWPKLKITLLRKLDWGTLRVEKQKSVQVEKQGQGNQCQTPGFKFEELTG